MSHDENVTLEERVLRLERRVDAIAAALGQRERAPSADAPLSGSGNTAPKFRREMKFGSGVNPVAGRSLEWWLARAGALLTSLALILLYQYAVERNWITPVVRVAMGVLVGGVFLFFAQRISRGSSDRLDDSIGLREVLLGAGLAAWFITAYAAAIFYGLISLSSARLIFFALSVAGAWLALTEHRSVLAFLTLGVGFLTPVLLPSSNPFVPTLALYLGALTAVGLVVYLMRGWQSILWLTTIAFWWTAGSATEWLGDRPELSRISLTLLVIAAGAALVRTPILRRRLLMTGSSLYTTPRSSELGTSIQEALARRIESFSHVKASVDSPALWIITILSPVLAVLLLSWIWASVEGSLWGIVSLGLAALAYRVARSVSDEEFTHVEATAVVVLSLAGTLWLADSVGTRVGQSSALMLGAAAAHAFATLNYLWRSELISPQKIAIATAMFCLSVVILSETMFRNFALQGFDTVWTLAEVGVIATCLWIWWTRRDPATRSRSATFFGVGSYVALMLVDARILGRVWPPLITASFAVAGAAFLILSRGRHDVRTLRQLGGFTLIVVLIRLFMIDLARVETIWRVVLFLGCGALFLFTSHRLQTSSSDAQAESAG
jgi:uncharacterized membrane protein